MGATALAEGGPLNLSAELHRALRQGMDEAELVEALEAFRDAGGSREMARHVLEDLRHQLFGEEAAVIEAVLDRVTGFCAPEDRIWPDPV